MEIFTHQKALFLSRLFNIAIDIKFSLYLLSTWSVSPGFIQYRLLCQKSIVQYSFLDVGVLYETNIAIKTEFMTERVYESTFSIFKNHECQKRMVENPNRFPTDFDGFINLQNVSQTKLWSEFENDSKTATFIVTIKNFLSLGCFSLRLLVERVVYRKFWRNKQLFLRSTVREKLYCHS